MTVKSFGCSFTWGSDLPGESFIPTLPSRFTWPALVAAHFESDYNCFAYPGVGNFFIADRVLNQCSVNTSNDDFFIINWTYIDRFDYVIDNGVAPEGTHIEWYGESPWRTCRPADNSEFYYANYHSEFKDKLASLQLVKLCIDTLSQLKIQFLMTAIDELMFDQNWHTSPGIKMLQDYVRPYITTFDNQTFVDYAISLGHKRNHNGHIDEHAHYDIAQYIIRLLDTQSTSGC